MSEDEASISNRRLAFSVFLWIFFATFAGGALIGCATSRPVPAPDLSTPGWKIRQGQAIWHPPSGKQEIAGELVLALRDNDETMVQFMKTPFPLVNSWSVSGAWHVEFVPEHRRFNGSGERPSRFIWPSLANCLVQHQPPPPGWEMDWDNAGHWRLENRRTGESLEGYLNP